MASIAVTRVPFHGDEILAVRGATPEATLVIMKPIVERLGLDWGGQHKKLLSHPILSKGISVTEIPSSGGPQEVVALQLSRLPFWLATVSANRVADAEVRKAILLYQEEAADALFRHFFGQATTHMGGTTKGELARLTAAIVDDKLDAHLLPVHAAMAELAAKMDAMAEGRVADQKAVPATEFIPALDVLKSLGWPAKGRRTVAISVSVRLGAFSARHSFPMRSSAERGVRLFHIDAVEAWKSTEGRAFLSALRDQREGQAALPFRQRGRKSD